MTRKEQIDQAVNSIYPSPFDSVSRVVFRKGIKWAEDNPNQESFNRRLKLEKEEWMEKALQWLEENAFRYVVKRTYNGVKVTGLHTSMVEDFKKYMEDK